MVGDLHVQGQVEQPGAVGARRAKFGGGGDGRFGGVVGVDAPDGIFFQVGDGDGGWIDIKKVGGECLDVALRYPRCAEIGINVAGQHVLGLHFPQGADIADVLRAGGLGGGEFLPHIAGQIGVGGLPCLRLRVRKDQVAKFGDDLPLSACRRGLPINGRSTAPFWFKDTSNPSSARAAWCRGNSRCGYRVRGGVLWRYGRRCYPAQRR